MALGRVTALGRTDTGRADGENEDTYAAWIRPPEVPSPLGVTALLAVADGVGEQARGQEASRLAVRLLETVLEAQEDRPTLTEPAELADYVRQTVAWVQERLVQLGAGERCGTTLTAMILQGDGYVLAHIGDSRAYRLRDGGLERLSHDHTHVGDQLRAGEISEEEAEVSPLRSKLTRYLGQSGTFEPQVSFGRLLPGDRLLLCTDGLTEHVGDTAITGFLGRGIDLGMIARNLLDRAREQGGRDDATVVVAQYGPPPTTAAEVPEPVDRPAVTLPLQLGHPGAPHRPKLPRWVVPALLVAVVLGMLTRGFLSRHGTRQMPEPTATVAAPKAAATPPAAPKSEVAGVQSPPPAPEPVKLMLKAKDNHVLLAGPPTLVVAEQSAERPVAGQNGAFDIRLKNSAGEQAWNLRPLDGGQATPKEGLLSGTDLPITVKPGQYMLVMTGHDVALLTVPGAAAPR